MSKTDALLPTQDDFGLNFTEYGIEVTLYDKTRLVKYSAHYLCDIERVAELMLCNMNEDYIKNADEYIWVNIDSKHESLTSSLNIDYDPDKVDELEFVNIDRVDGLIINHITEFREYNKYHTDLDYNDTRDLSDITKRIRSMKTENHMDNMYYAMSSNMITNKYYKLSDVAEAFKLEPIDSNIKILFYYMNVDTRRYFISDIKNMSDHKLRYILTTLTREFFDSHGAVQFVYLEQYNRFGWVKYNIDHIGEIYNRILKSVPNTIDKFPFKVFDNKIPSISTFPGTPFNWLLTNNVIDRVGIICNTLVNIEANTGTKAIKDNTAALLPYIQCPLEAFELYIKYRLLETDGIDGSDFCDDFYDYLDQISGKNLIGYMQLAIEKGYYTDDDNDGDVYKFDGTRIYNNIKAFLQFIEDGKDIKKSYPDMITLDDGYELKMAKVEGTILKQVRNSIYNHHEEKKISIEQKLRLLDKGELMESDVEVPQEIRKFHIATKKRLIYNGRELGHCIGGKTNSKHLFFRRGTSCAEVIYDKKRFMVSTCLDAKNHITDESKEFEKYLIEQLDGVTPVYKDKDIHE